MEKAYAKKLINIYDQNNVIKEVNKNISAYWKAIKASLAQSDLEMKDLFDIQIKELEKN